MDFGHKKFNKKHIKGQIPLQNTATELVSHALFIPIGFLH